MTRIASDDRGAALLPITERETVAGRIGQDAESLVYLYASCDRGVVYPRIGDDLLVFRDRFTDNDIRPPLADLRAFMDITVANELDVLAHNAELAARWTSSLHGLFVRAGDLISPAAQAAFRAQLAS